MWLPSRIYIGSHPAGPNARLIPRGGDEERRLISGLEVALAPHMTEEGRKSREALPDKLDPGGRYWQLIYAEGLLDRLHDLADKEDH